MINFKKKGFENFEEIRDSALPRAPAPELLQCWVGPPRWVPLPRNLKKIPKTKEKKNLEKFVMIRIQQVRINLE